MDMHSIYLDFNSTAPLLPEAAEAMAQAQAADYANPASQHALGRRAHRALEEVRDEISQLLGANLSGPTPDVLLFTSGGTEANNLAVIGLTGASSSAGCTNAGKPGRIIISAIEHPSVTAAADFLTTLGWHIDRLDVTSDGAVCLEHLDQLLAESSPSGLPKLVSVM